MLTIIIVIVVLVVAVGLFVVTGINRLRQQRVSVDEAMAGIDVQLTRRAELVPNLVETVKGYASHEKGVFEAVTAARAAAQSAGTVDQKAAADGQMRQALANLAAVLADAGASLDDVAKTTVFVTDLGFFGGVNDVYAEAFGAHRTARSTIEVAAFPIDCV